MAFDKLSMGRSEDDVVELSSGYEGFYTGHMGDCTSAIVLWEFDAQRAFYGRMRAIHCGGGLFLLMQNVAIRTKLFAEVPNAASTLIYLTGGSIDVAGHDETQRARLVASKNLPSATTFLKNASQAWVRQTGQLLLSEPRQAPPVNIPKSSRCCVIL